MNRADTEQMGGAAPEIPGFILREPLGDGGYAQVWTALRQTDGAIFAAKIGHADTQSIVARFAREAEILKQVGPPFSPQWYENGLVDGKPFIVMELIRGETLARKIADLPSPPEISWVATIAERIVTALDALHSKALMHRDLKPENIIITDDSSRAVLLDFGLAKRVISQHTDLRDARVTRAGMAIGTPEYMAPETVRGADDVDARADVYAIGILLYELFTLRVPFVGSGAMIEHGHVSLRPPRPSDFASVPPLWEQLIFACLAKDPSRRPANADAVRRAIREISDLEPLLKTMGVPRSVPSQTPAIPKLLSEGRHPTVLLFAEIAGPAALICNRIKSARGHVVRQRGAQYMAIFSGFDTDDPANAAILAAQEIVQKGGRAALHLAQVTIRRKERGAPLVYGATVERPETWLPRGGWTGLVFTNELREILPPESMGSPGSSDPQSLRPSLRSMEIAEKGGPDGVRHDNPSQSGELDRLLIGREEATGVLENGMRLAFLQRAPRLTTFVGDAGLGKTRLAEYAITFGKTQFPEARVVFAAAAPPGVNDHSFECARILKQILDAPNAAPNDAKSFFDARFGERFNDAETDTLCALLGWSEPGPGNQSTQRMRAIARALRSCARTQPIAVILDDGHRADDALLDALEFVTLDGENLPIWVLVTAGLAFDEQRRSWGKRTRFYDRLTLGPLTNEATKDLAGRLLHPAEYPPAAVLERLMSWSGGNPYCLREVVRALKRLGIVRKRDHGDSYYVATAEVEGLPPIPAWQWLAVRQLDQMPPELAACVRLCAVLGMSFERQELDHVLDALDRTGKAGSPLDSDVALGALESRGILQRVEGERYSFKNGALEGAIYDLLDAAQRQEVHRHAFELWKEVVEASAKPTADALERLGRHAAALGEHEHAANAFLQLGGLSRNNHKDVDADRYYSAALAHASDDDKLARAEAFLGRGRSRYRVSRVKEAIDDFTHARELADQLGHRRMQAEVLLEKATAFDWSREFAASEERVLLAEPIVAALDAPDLHIRLMVARGRTAFRGGRAAESIELFERALIASTETNDYDALVITLLLLASQLAAAGRLDDAERRFHEVVTMAEEANDRPHLCVALANRVGLWYGRRALDRAMQDLQRSIGLAREIGNPWLERLAAHNIATLLHWTDARAEALEYGRRAQFLTERFFEPAFITSSLLYCRILVTADAFEEANRLYDWIKQVGTPEHLLSNRVRWNHGMLELVLREFVSRPIAPGDDGPQWDAVVAIAEKELEKQNIIEVLYWRLRTAIHAGAIDSARQTLQKVRERLVDCPLWGAEFDAMAKTLDSIAR